jgi:tetratricopeptide (TPR) repeat protein
MLNSIWNMMIKLSIYNVIVAAAIALWAAGSPVAAQVDRLDGLFDSLRDPGTTDWQRVEDEIERRMSFSGSASADLLLRRGIAALEVQDYAAAIDHLTALVDHAPEFAEGWNSRASAYFLAGLYGPAMEDLARVLVLEPRHFGALSGIGIIFEETDQPVRALAAFRAAAAIHPQNPDIQAAILRLERATEGTAL